MATVANYIRCELPERPPDYISYSKSVYWNLGNRVIRCSDHWGPKIATCCWYLDFNIIQSPHCYCGVCYFEDFRPTLCLKESDIF